MYFENLTAPEINKLRRSIPVILPIGSTEQHGDHLPVSTDSDINRLLCSEMERNGTENQLILPVIKIACSGHHLSLGGTLTVSIKTMIAYLEDLIDSLSSQGFFNILIFNSHGGNIGLTQCAGESSTLRHPKLNMLILTWWTLIRSELKDILSDEPHSTGHACEAETSLIMHADQKSVRSNLIKDEVTIEMPEWANGDLFSGPAPLLIKEMEEYSSNGVRGKPSLATTEKGKLITAAFGKAITPILKQIDALPPRKS